MAKKKGNQNFEGRGSSESCCKVESIITIDERGQLILPKEVRQKASLEPGEKLLVVVLEKEKTACCLALIKVSEIEKEVEELISPLFKGMALKT